MKGQDLAMIVMSTLAIVELCAICVLIQYLPIFQEQPEPVDCHLQYERPRFIAKDTILEGDNNTTYRWSVECNKAICEVGNNEYIINTTVYKKINNSWNTIDPVYTVQYEQRRIK